MSNTTSNERGRPPEVAPVGHVTIAEAAEAAGVSYATVYKHVKKNLVRSSQAENGAIYIRREDVRKIKLAQRPRSKRPSVTIRLEPDRLRRWAAAAGDRTVGEWLGELADKAVRRVEDALADDLEAA